MKFKVGDILRSEGDFPVEIENGQLENVKKGEYFVVIKYGKYETEYDEGWVLLSQKTMNKSYWSKENCDIENCFCKE